tara:strand:- start:1245 stop:2483 length:1239 start_codon:yes stop_codon:yes gene_type:complete
MRGGSRLFGSLFGSKKNTGEDQRGDISDDWMMVDVVEKPTNYYDLLVLRNTVSLREKSGKHLDDIPNKRDGNKITVYRGTGGHGPNEMRISFYTKSGTQYSNIKHFRVEYPPESNKFYWASDYDLRIAGYKGDKFNDTLTQVGMAKAVTAPAGGFRARMTDKITFYKKGDPFYEFTNYFSREDKNPLFYGDEKPFISGESESDHKGWPTTEHYFQVYKFLHGTRTCGRRGTPKAPTDTAYIDKLYMEAFKLGTGNNGLKAMGPEWAKEVSIRDQVSVNNGWWHGSSQSTHVAGKLRVMYNAVKMKFKQNDGSRGTPNLKQLLLDTGSAILVENAGRKDKYWGDGEFKISGGGSGWDFSKINDPNGGNKLGLLLMQIRDELNGLPLGTTCPENALIRPDSTYNQATKYFHLVY